MLNHLKSHQPVASYHREARKIGTHISIRRTGCTVKPRTIASLGKLAGFVDNMKLIFSFVLNKSHWLSFVDCLKYKISSVR